MRTLENPDLEQRALSFARQAHGYANQRRKYSGEPYEIHCIEVAAFVRLATRDARAVAASLLHDVLEDTVVSSQTLLELFGPIVTGWVLEVTDISKPDDGNRSERKEKDRLHIAKASPIGKTIKVADCLSNTPSIVANDKDFAKVYVEEVWKMLPSLAGAFPPLLRLLRDQILALKTDSSIFEIANFPRRRRKRDFR